MAKNSDKSKMEPMNSDMMKNMSKIIKPMTSNMMKDMKKSK